MKTLLINTSYDTQINTKTTLEALGLDVVAVDDGVNAWIQLCDATTPFQLVISDWLLPSPLDSVSLCQKIRSAPFLSSTYVMIMTNRTSSTDLQQGIKAGVDDFISAAPFNTDEFESKLRLAKRVLGLEKNSR